MSKHSRIPTIDILRAVAVLSVIAYHLNSRALPGGFIGVDIFFVISGYVVTRALASRVGMAWHTYIVDFYSRRILRIFPALLVCLIVTVFIDALLVPQAWLSSQNYSTAKYAFFGLSNVFLYRNQESYFSPRVEFNPYLHTWSLGVEEQFYLFLPLIYFVQRRMAARSGKKFNEHLLLLVSVLSFAISAYYSFSKPALAYYSLLSRFWELGLGALLSEYHRRHDDHVFFKAIPQRMALGISIALLVGGLVASDQAYFPVPYALLAIFGTLGVIDGAVGNRWQVGSSPGVRMLLYVGAISYSLYLWHWPVFTLFRWTTGLATWPFQLAAIVCVGLLSTLSYHFVEQPFQRPKFSQRQRAFALATGVVVIFMGALVASQINRERASVTLSITGDMRAWYPYNWSSIKDSRGCHSHEKSESYRGAQLITISREGCDDGGARRTLFVAGDSHAGAYETLLGKLATEEPYTVKIFLMPGCPFFTMSSPMSTLPATCADFVRDSLADIRHLAKPQDVLFLPSLRLARFGGQFGDFADEAGAHRSPQEEATLRREAIDEAQSVLADLGQVGLQIIFEAPKPIFRSPAFRCSDWFNAHNPVCSGGLTEDAQFLRDYRMPVVTALATLAEKDPQVRIWDPFPILCPGKTCYAVEYGIPLFFDGNHLSGAGNQRLFSSFASFISSGYTRLQ